MGLLENELKLEEIRVNVCVENVRLQNLFKARKNKLKIHKKD